MNLSFRSMVHVKLPVRGIEFENSSVEGTVHESPDSMGTMLDYIHVSTVL